MSQTILEPVHESDEEYFTPEPDLGACGHLHCKQCGCVDSDTHYHCNRCGVSLQYTSDGVSPHSPGQPHSACARSPVQFVGCQPCRIAWAAEIIQNQ